MHSRINIQNSQNNVIYISSTTIDKDFKTSLHLHQNLEIILITNGNGEVITSNRKIPVKKNDLLIINPNSKHYETGKGLSFVAIGIRGSNIYLQSTYTKKIIVRSLENNAFNRLKYMFDLINDEALRKGINSSTIIDSSYSIISSYIMELFSLKEAIYEGNDSELVANIKDILNNYFASEIRLDEIAHRLSTSKANICHIFKRETGKTIIQYKLERQLEESCNLLTISDMSISQIASLVGFNSDAYFIKMFKTKYSITPSEYRKK